MYQEQINAYWSDPARREELVSVLSRLVAVKSVKGEAAPGAPFGPGPAAALDEALSLCRELGFSAQSYDGYVGLCDLNGEETRLHILGHLDVVGEGSGWSTDPYACVEKDGVLYGRGVSDDKGPVVCALLAMKAVRDLGLPLSANARLILGTDEESGSSDIAYYYAREPYAPYAFTPDAELVCRQVSERTGAVFTISPSANGCHIHCQGKNAHAASPDDGINAIAALLDALSFLPLAECGSTRAVRAMAELFPFGDNRGRALGIAMEDAKSGPLTLNLALMKLTETGFSAKFDVRFPLCASEDNCRRACEAAFAARGIAVTEDPEMRPAHEVPADSELVRTLLGCYSAWTGEADPKPIAIGGGTYVHDIPGGVAFGCCFPGYDTRMHAADERIPVKHLLTACKIYTQAIAELCR